MPPVAGPRRPGGGQDPGGGPHFDGDELIEAEALLSGSGAGAEGGIVVPWPLLFRHRIHHRLTRSERYQWWVLWTVLAGLLSVNITFTVFVVALPQVATQLHTTVSTLTWTSTAPLLAFGVAAPILGKLGDLRGYRRLYLWGLGGAAVSVVLTATAPTAGVLIAARLFDGVQGAATGAASMALVLQAFSHGDRVKAMGWWALVGAGGPVLGVTIGAPIIQYLGWRALFWGELPLMAVAAVLAVVVLPSGSCRRGVPADSDRPSARPDAGPGQSPPWGRRPARARGPSSTGRARSPCRPPSPPDCWASTWPLPTGSPPRYRVALFAACLVTRDGLRPPRAAGPPPADPAALLPDAQLRLPPRGPHLRQLLLHGRVLPLPHPHGTGLRLQRDRGRSGVDGPAAPVLGGGSHRRLRRRQGGGAVLHGGRSRRPCRLHGGLHPARSPTLAGRHPDRPGPVRGGQRPVHAGHGGVGLQRGGGRTSSG